MPKCSKALKTYVESYTNHNAVVKEKERLAKVSKRIEIESANAAAALRKAKQQLRGRMKNSDILNALEMTVEKVYPRADDLEEEWINDFFSKDLKIKLCLDYADVIIHYDDSDKKWKAITATDCEWFDIESSNITDVLNYVGCHNESGRDEWGVALAGGPHSGKSRICMGPRELRRLSLDDCIALSNRYSVLYVLGEKSIEDVIRSKQYLK